jgi:4-hydroxybenzoyl-CoA reductase subunit beta
MLPLPLFQHHSPESLDEAVALLAALGPGARIIAGGTDLVPNMKHGLFEPSDVVSLGRVSELVGVDVIGGTLVIGAMTRLADVAADARVRQFAPALASALGAVGGPHHRRMGTLGGNVCLDTRCVYYNQTYFWREALGFCLKKDGTACHVVSSGKHCVAAASNDSAPALMVLEGEIELASAKGTRRLLADDFYTTDGIVNTVKRPDEIVTRVRVPIREGRRSAFEKLRRRGAIDFPLLNVAVRADVDQAGVAELDLVVSALAARPKRVSAAKKVRALDDAAVAALCDAAYKQCRPLTNIDVDADWRREMVPVLVRKALAQLVS